MKITNYTGIEFIHHNRPDITLVDKKQEIVPLIDTAIPNTHNLTQTHSEKTANLLWTYQ